MNEQDKIDLAVKYAWSLSERTRRYQWGGDDPILGFDCSGFVVEILAGIGILKHNQDMSSQGLFDLFVKNSTVWGGPGALSFYGKNEASICHVGFCVSSEHMLEAGGGNSSVTDDKTAIERNAFIKLRPILYRKDFVGVLKPKYV